MARLFSGIHRVTVRGAPLYLHSVDLALCSAPIFRGIARSPDRGAVRLGAQDDDQRSLERLGDSAPRRLGAHDDDSSTSAVVDQPRTVDGPAGLVASRATPRCRDRAVTRDAAKP